MVRVGSRVKGFGESVTVSFLPRKLTLGLDSIKGVRSPWLESSSSTIVSLG